MRAESRRLDAAPGPSRPIGPRSYIHWGAGLIHGWPDEGNEMEAGLTMWDCDFPWCFRANSAFASSAFCRPEDDLRCDGMALFKEAAMMDGERYWVERGVV